MLFYHPDLNGEKIVLSPDESGHAIRVLRLKAGDEISITDGKGQLATAIITDPNPRKCKVEIKSRNLVEDKPLPIHIAISPTKSIDRVTWFVEKAVEIGIASLSFPICKNSERKKLNMDKIRAKAISALKQSKATYLPDISEAIPFSKFLQKVHSESEKYIAHPESNRTPELTTLTKKGSSYLVLIGPEGDFTKDEIKMAVSRGFIMVKLGNKRLRTETAALHACSLLNGINY